MVNLWVSVLVVACCQSIICSYSMVAACKTYNAYTENKKKRLNGFLHTEQKI